LKSRNLLGESFGTKKVKQKIRALEKNRIGSNALSSSTSEIQTAIDTGALNAPSKEKLEEELAEDRPIPPYDAETKDVASIYQYHDIISKEEYKLLNVRDIIKVPNKAALREALAGDKTSEYVLNHMNTILATTSKDKHRAKTVLYVHYLISLYRLSPRLLKDGTSLTKHIHGLSLPIANILCQKFAMKTDAGGGNIRYNWPTRSKEKVLLYMLALCLTLDNFSLYFNVVMKDLGLSLSKMSIYLRELGCSIQTLTATQREALGLDDLMGKNARKAILSAPVSFPKPRKMKK